MKPTAQQMHVLQRIQNGYPHIARIGDRDTMLTVQTFQWSRDGDAIVAHRTVLRDGPAPMMDPRLAYRTELYRIQRDGSVARL